MIVSSKDPNGLSASHEAMSTHVNKSYSQQLAVYVTVNECERRWSIEDLERSSTPLKHGPLQTSLQKIHLLLNQSNSIGELFRTMKNCDLTKSFDGTLNWVISENRASGSFLRRTKNFAETFNQIISTLDTAIKSQCFEFTVFVSDDGNTSREKAIVILDIAKQLMESEWSKLLVRYHYACKEGIYRVMFKAAFTPTLKTTDTLMEFITKARDLLESLSQSGQQDQFMAMLRRTETEAANFRNAIDQFRSKPDEFFSRTPYIDATATFNAHELMKSAEYSQSFEVILAKLNSTWLPIYANFKKNLYELINKVCKQSTMIPKELIQEYKVINESLNSSKIPWNKILNTLRALDSYKQNPYIYHE